MERMVAVSKPLLDLLKSKPQNATLLLTNPKEIAAYNGGEITSQIASLDEQSLKSYIAGLNGDVKKIDTKLFSMESVKEQGMNFLANLPPNGLMMDFFKWLLSFDFIAKLLGYK